MLKLRVPYLTVNYVFMGNDLKVCFYIWFKEQENSLSNFTKNFQLWIYLNNTYLYYVPSELQAT